jgi:holo-[acyl-carrier protein] synthase
LNRIFTKQEVAYCASKKKHLQHFAVRFAAKEAVWKALSDTLRKSKATLGHRDIGVKNDPSGKPVVVLPAKFKRLEKKISISLSHTSSYAVAVASVRS